jgi:hypothetical protein
MSGFELDSGAYGMDTKQLLGDIDQLKPWEESIDLDSSDETKKLLQLSSLREYAIFMARVVKNNHGKLCNMQGKMAKLLQRLKSRYQHTRDGDTRYILKAEMNRRIQMIDPLQRKCAALAKAFNAAQKRFRRVDSMKPKNEADKDAKKRLMVALIGQFRNLMTGPTGDLIVDPQSSALAVTREVSTSNDQQLKKIVKSFMIPEESDATAGLSKEMSAKQFRDLPEDAGVKEFEAYNADELMDSGPLRSLKAQAERCQDLNCLGKVLREYTPKYQAGFWAASGYQSRTLWNLCVNTVKIACGIYDDPTNEISSALTRQQLAVIYHKALVPLGYHFLDNRLHLVPQCDNFRGHTNSNPAQMSTSDFERGDASVWRQGVFRIQDSPDAVVRKLKTPETLDNTLGGDTGFASGFAKGPGEMSLFGGSGNGKAALAGRPALEALLNKGRTGMLPTGDKQLAKITVPVQQRKPPSPRVMKVKDPTDPSGMNFGSVNRAIKGQLPSDSSGSITALQRERNLAGVVSEDYKDFLEDQEATLGNDAVVKLGKLKRFVRQNLKVDQKRMAQREAQSMADVIMPNAHLKTLEDREMTHNISQQSVGGASERAFGTRGLVSSKQSAQRRQTNKAKRQLQVLGNVSKQLLKQD